MTDPITGRTLIGWGFAPGPWFPEALALAQRLQAAGTPEPELRAAIQRLAPPVLERLALHPRNSLPLGIALDATTPEEAENKAAVIASMQRLLQVPVVTAGAVMPDACPAGPPGTIPVGGIVASHKLHPGMHSADICCSVALSSFGSVAPKDLLDAVQAVTHFGGGGRRPGSEVQPPDSLLQAFAANPLLAPTLPAATAHFATQGDGNHFAFVGTSRRNGETVLVTHHGSRGPGASLYKAGMALAQRQSRERAPESVDAWNLWIEPETKEGEQYWQALQLIRQWTRANHFAIHDRAAERLQIAPQDRFWNEHNFVFRKSDGLFYHGKGATPAWEGWAEDATELTLIPLNMAEPVLVVRGRNQPMALGFSPHGAGRNRSRGAHLRALAGRRPEDVIAEQAPGIDVRFWARTPDLSELPAAYKTAATVRAQIEAYDLAEVVDEILPYGSIMAGDWFAPLREKKKAGKAKVEDPPDEDDIAG